MEIWMGLWVCGENGEGGDIQEKKEGDKGVGVGFPPTFGNERERK